MNNSPSEPIDFLGIRTSQAGGWGNGNNGNNGSSGTGSINDYGLGPENYTNQASPDQGIGTAMDGFFHEPDLEHGPPVDAYPEKVLPPTGTPGGLPTSAPASFLSTNVPLTHTTLGGQAPIPLTGEQLFTVPEGQILYYGTDQVETFQPYRLNFGGDHLHIFTTSLDFAADQVRRCADFPVRRGYVHKFITKEKIPAIKIISSYELTAEDTGERLLNKFCRSVNPGLEGIGIQFPVPNLADSRKPSVEMEFGLCNPQRYLSYLGTFRCSSRRYFHPTEYRFND